MNNKRIWVTWETQRRNKSLSKKLGAKYFEVLTQKTNLIRYPANLFKTLVIYLKEQPNLIFVQNPSIVLALFSVLYGKVMDVPVVVDAHNAGVYPQEGTSSLLRKVAIIIFKKASFTIVTNTYLADYVINNGGDAFVLPDPLPEFNGTRHKIQDKRTYSVLFICTWATDEPFLEVIKAAEFIDESITINITGKIKEQELRKLKKPVPKNVNFTGFLPDDDYLALLQSSDIIIDLTTRENCLVCGAYEGVAAEIPLILSDKKILKEYFYKGVVFTENNHTDISNNIKHAIEILDNLKHDVKLLKSELTIQWDKELHDLETRLKNISSA